MNLDDFTAASLQRMNIGKVERIWIPPRLTLEAVLAHIEVHHTASNLWCFEHNIGTRDEAAAERWRKQLRFVHKAHALGFISDERHKRITVPWTPGQPDNSPPHDEWQALLRLNGKHFPQWAGNYSGGSLFWVYADDTGNNFLWLTREGDHWIIHPEGWHP